MRACCRPIVPTPTTATRHGEGRASVRALIVPTHSRTTLVLLEFTLAEMYGRSRSSVEGGFAVSDEQHEVLAHVTADRRDFIRKYVLGAAFAVPVVASFFMRGGSGFGSTFTTNSVCFTSNSGARMCTCFTSNGSITVTVPTSPNDCKNGGWTRVARTDCTTFASECDCLKYVGAVNEATSTRACMNGGWKTLA